MLGAVDVGSSDTSCLADLYKQPVPHSPCRQYMLPSEKPAHSLTDESTVSCSFRLAQSNHAPVLPNNYDFH